MPTVPILSAAAADLGLMPMLDATRKKMETDTEKKRKLLEQQASSPYRGAAPNGAYMSLTGNQF